jgi:hypothetical protein
MTKAFLSALYQIFSLLFFSFGCSAQTFELKEGFDAQECEDVFKLNFAFLDTVRLNKFPDFLKGYAIHYRSPSVGLDNSSDIWIREDSTVAIMLRGTTGKMESILEDFYCAMIPAKGIITLSKNKSFAYQLADDPRAAVHAGFLIGFAYLADDIQPQISNLYSQGYRKFLVGGHSQGGSLSYCISAWLMQLREKGVFEDIQIKTYASAPPKMGNMYFAYEYDNANLSRWSFSIVNTADPVPEMPFTTQQIEVDMNEPNPILNLVERFNALPFLKRVLLKNAFNKMRKRARQSSEAYQKYLGKHVGKFIHESLPEMILPKPVPSTYFVRPGVPITLSANDAYWAYCKDTPKYFHHGVDPYRFLLRQYYRGLPTFEPMIKE